MEEEKPQVVFLEALENTYSNYDRLRHLSFGVYHEKLEIEAIQKYSKYASFEYVPVLDIGLSDLFREKYERLCENRQHQEMTEELNSIAKTKGFLFLNSQLSMTLHEKIRKFETHLLDDSKVNKAVNADIDTYEYEMMRNIYSYCKSNQFSKAVFMCGSAHRQSLIEKIRYFSNKEDINIDWTIYGS